MAKKGDKKAAPANGAKASSNGTLLRRLTAKTIIGKIERPSKDVDLYTIFGVANNSDVKESTFGPSTRFLGNFRAVRASDGKVFRGPTCYLPEPVSSMLKAALDGRHPEAGTGEVKGIEFGFKVSITPADESVRKSTTGYEYRTESLTEPVESDEMQALAARVGVPALTHAKE